MKTRFFSTVLLLALTTTFALGQMTDNAKISFAILGGVNVQNLNGKDFSGNKLEYKTILGYHGGINVQMPIAPEFFLQPGVLFTTKGAKNEGVLITSTYNVSSIEVPINLVYKGALSGGYVMVGFGPYVSYGIMGTANFEGGAVSLETDIEFKNVVEIGDPLTTTYMKALDAGGNVFIGYEMAAGLFLQVNAQLGMLNLKPEDKRFPDDKSEIRNTGFGASLGYRF